MSTESNRWPPSPRWSSVIIASLWLVLAWRLNAYIIGDFNLFHLISPRGTPSPLYAWASYVVVFFKTFAVWPSAIIAGVILGKDAVVTAKTSRILNMVLSVLLLLLLLAGWASIMTAEVTRLGIVR
jgi:hypothetical protein